MATLQRVVVTGLGALTPIGNNVEAFWQGLINGTSGAATITYFDPQFAKTKFACEIKNLNVTDHLDRKAIRRMDSFSQYALIASQEAINDAQLVSSEAENAPDNAVDPDRVGVIWSSGIGGITTFQDEIIRFAEKGNSQNYRFSPFFIPKMIIDIAAGLISMEHGFRGPNFSVVSACASSTNGMQVALDAIRLGRCDVVVCGGSESSVNHAGIGGFGAMKALSERNDSPETASRPFDKDRDGFVLGEGAGAIVLESLDHALARGARIYCELAGAGATADAYHLTAPHPEGLGAYNVMKKALNDAKLNVDDIDYINVHGTSTPLGDIAETQAIVKLFGDAAYKLNISSTKSMTGHLLGAAGAIEAIATILSIVNNIVPPTINHFTDDPAFDPNLNFTFNKAQERQVSAALSNTFGFGGHNASVAFKAYEA